MDEDVAAKRRGRMDKGKGKAGSFKAVRDGDFDEFGLEPASEFCVGLLVICTNNVMSVCDARTS